jgi:hypothetical protein
MKISVYPEDKINENCLLLVGGSGDTAKGFEPLVTKLIDQLVNYSICTFSFASKSEVENLLDIQSRELEEVLSQLVTEYHFKKIDIFCTSQGAYSTAKVLASHKFNESISSVIMYDPADYYMDGTNLHSWSGPQEYVPNRKVVSDDLVGILGNYKVNVVHLTLRNHGTDGYLEIEHGKRGEDNPGGYPRLSTQMVKNFFIKIPSANKGEYIEVSDVPHAILRDGNISQNIDSVANTVSTLLAK